MSSNPTLSADPTGNIGRANRLMSLRAHPGFLDLLQISADLVQHAVKSCSTYPGWDPQVMVVLKVRQQCATEHHEALIEQIRDAIQAGIQEAAAMPISRTPEAVAEAVDNGDYVRQAVLTKFGAMETDDRIPGSY
jgi:hypothetical protein